MSIAGNQAWIGGVFTDVKPPFENFNGVDFGFFVIDNGSGAKSPADVLSNTLPLQGGATAADYCEIQPPDTPGIFFPIESGNIKIH